jgi:hypothetical protein
MNNPNSDRLETPGIRVAAASTPSSDATNSPARLPEAISRRTFLSGLGALGLSACGSHSSSAESSTGSSTGGSSGTTTGGSSSSAFVHPGLLHTQADFDRMSLKVAANASPWVDSWNRLIANNHADKSRVPQAVPVIYRGSDGVHAENFDLLYNDVHAAYACALRWKISGDAAYADEAVRIMNAWSATLTGFGGTIDAFLASGIQGYQFANAGEIMRTYSGWAAADFASFQSMMLDIFYPNNHQGLSQSLTPLTVYSSWQLCCIAAILAIGVLCDDQAKFDEAISYFKTGLGNGGIAQAIYYIHPGYLGQTQESGRDQGHNTLSISLMTNICEMAWNQGVDLYGYDNNRILAGAEYIAKGNLIESGTTYYAMPFATYKASGIDDTVFATAGQGNVRPEWALIYNHYVNRKGLAAPWCQKFAALISPEGGNYDYGGGGGSYDQLGYGTLTCTRDPIASGAAPSGLTAVVSGGQVILSWWGSAYATSYKVQRGTTAGGPYATVAPAVTDLLTCTDSGLAAGTYYYVVTATTPSGETVASNEAVAITTTQLHTDLAFDEGSGTGAADSSGHAHAGTLVNGATWAAGKKGNAVSLNGSDGYVSLPADLLVDVADFTIAAWVYWNAASNWARVFDLGADTDRYMMLTARNGSGVARFAMTLNSGDGEQVIDSTAALPTGQWVHVAVTLSGNVGTLYVNGAVAGTNTTMQFAPFRLGSTSQNWIGRSQYSADPYFDGLVDEFRIHRGALSAEQVAALIAA